MAVEFKRGNALASLSLTPLIDVVFLLLIFFLVATRFAEEEQEMELPLPSATEAKPLSQRPRELFINIDREGNFFLDGKTMQMAEVEEVIRRSVANNPTGQSVVIRADRRVPFQFVVSLSDLCSRVGVADFTVTTEGKP